LKAAGFDIAGPFATCADAENWLKTQQPDAAILDSQLKDGPCDAVATDLTRRGVPLVIFSGHDDRREGSSVACRGLGSQSRSHSKSSLRLLDAKCSEECRSGHGVKVWRALRKGAPHRPLKLAKVTPSLIPKSHEQHLPLRRPLYMFEAGPQNNFEPRAHFARQRIRSLIFVNDAPQRQAQACARYR
jgi:hypothetical protein